MGYGTGAYGGIARVNTGPQTPFDYRVFIRDANGLRQGELTTFTQASFKPLYCDVGTWSVTLDRRDPMVPMLCLPGYGIEVRRQGHLVIGGPANYRQHAVTGSASPQTNQITVSGFSDEIWLKRRLCLPTPHTTQTPYSVYTTTAANAVYGPAVASTAILAIVNDNLGPGAVAARQLANLSLAADPAIGASVTQSLRFDNLLTTIQTLATAGGVGFRLLPNGDSTFTFSVYANTDRSQSVKFSTNLGNLSDFTYDDTAPTETWEYVLGSSSNSSDPMTQSIMEANDPTGLATWGRMEGTASDTSDITASAMTTAALAQLAQAGEQSTMTANIVEIPGAKYAVDFNIGDIVSFQLEDWAYTPAGLGAIRDIVRTVDIEMMQGQTPTTVIGVGTPKVAQVSALFSTIKNQQKQLQRLIARAK
jgi:hypothetical protein